MKYDVVVIGSGPGGYVAAIRAAQLGFKTACIEKDKTLGGTCLNVGCIPSKALLQSTEHYAWIKHDSKNHGIDVSNLEIDFSQMMKRKELIVAGLVQGISTLFKQNNVASIKGSAKLLSPHTIEISDSEGKQTIEAERIILATGSEPIGLPFLPFDEKKILSSTGILSLAQIPKKLVVIGGGVIGVELASVYNRLGTEVIVIEMLDKICAGMDEAISKSLLQILKKQGITFHLNAKVVDGKTESKGVKLNVEIEGKSQEIQADAVLIAIGRKPFNEGLGLKELGMQMNRNQVVVDSGFRTSIPNIFAIGDLIDGPMLAHKASEEGYVLAELLAGKRSKVNYMAIPNIIYTHPEAASVGLTEKEAKDASLDVVVGNVQFRGNARARCAGDTDGFVKVIGAGPEKRLVGMHIVGPQASELIHAGMLGIEKKMTLKEMAHSPFGHPTLSEAIKEACLAIG